MTRQLVGVPWLNAGRFCYCGSIGPLALNTGLLQAFCQMGTILAKAFHLRGVFGVDCIVREGVPWPVQVNPRYTASVEVLEYALGRSIFDRRSWPATFAPCESHPVIGKAILFARTAGLFPAVGPWNEFSPGCFQSLPAFADIPLAGETFQVGQPVLTFFCRAATEAACLERLEQIASDLDRSLFGS